MIDWIDQRLNPVLVKDVRAWLRSKKFLIVFFSAMFLIQGVTLVLTAIPDEEIGSLLFTILSSGLGFFLVGVLPFLMHDRFTDELSSGSTELALISRMTPGQLVRGKITSGVLASLLFFSAVGPSLTIAYMLGGVDLVLLLYMVGLLLFCSVISMILAILLVSLTGRRRLKFLGLLPIALGLGMSVLAVAMTEVISDEGAHLDVTFWLVHAVLAGYVTLFSLFLYTSAVSRLSFEADNRDMRPRLALSALVVLPVALGLALSLLSSWLVPTTSDPEELLVFCIILSQAVFVFGSFFVLTTPDRYSTRIRGTASRILPLRLVLYPGPGRLYAFILLHVAFLTAVSVLPGLLFGADGEITYGLLTASFVAIPTVLGGCTLVHFGLTKLPAMRTRKIPRGFVVVVLFIVWMLAALPVGILVDALDIDDVGLVIHPVTAIAYVADEESLLSFLLALLVHSLVLIPSMLYWGFEIIRATGEDIGLTLSRFRASRTARS
jgi:hypothetical protein